MSDGEGVERLLGAGQRTTEHVGGRDERRELWAHFLDLCKRRILPPFWLVLAVPLLVGPWILAVYVPLAVEQGAAHVADWLRLKDAPEPDRGSLAALGVLVAVVLLFLPDAAIIWLYPWQRAHAGWLGLRWPARFPQWIPLMIALRFTLAYAVTRAWRIEEPHITNRQRREEELPTTSGIAFDTTAPHLVDIPGTHNPHRNPEAPPEAQAQTVTRVMFRMPDGDGRTGARIVDCPEDIATTDQLRELARLVLQAGVSPTRTQIATKRGLFTDPGWRAFQDWAVAQGFLEKTGTATNAPYIPTEEGYTWLTVLMHSDGEPF